MTNPNTITTPGSENGRYDMFPVPPQESQIGSPGMWLPEGATPSELLGCLEEDKRAYPGMELGQPTAELTDALNVHDRVREQVNKLRQMLVTAEIEAGEAGLRLVDVASQALDEREAAALRVAKEQSELPLELPFFSNCELPTAAELAGRFQWVQQLVHQGEHLTPYEIDRTTLAWKRGVIDEKNRAMQAFTMLCIAATDACHYPKAMRSSEATKSNIPAKDTAFDIALASFIDQYRPSGELSLQTLTEQLGVLGNDDNDPHNQWARGKVIAASGVAALKKHLDDFVGTEFAASNIHLLKRTGRSRLRVQLLVNLPDTGVRGLGISTRGLRVTTLDREQVRPELFQTDEVTPPSERFTGNRAGHVVEVWLGRNLITDDARFVDPATGDRIVNGALNLRSLNRHNEIALTSQRR